jgi:hypothetical protein
LTSPAKNLEFAANRGAGDEFRSYQGIVRVMPAAVGGLQLRRGFVDNQNLNIIISPVMAIGATFWSVHNNRTGKVIGSPNQQ